VTPLELFGLICLFAVLRIALSVNMNLTTAPPAPAAASGEGASAIVRPTKLVLVLREYLDAFIVAGLAALFLITFVIRTFFIPSGSMEPTLQINDLLLVNEFEYRFHQPKDEDIVVFRPPIATPNDFIKRLIGSPGDSLRVHDGTVYRNGKALDEPYIAQKPNYELEVKDYGVYVDGQPLDPQLANIPPRSRWQAPDRIPAGFYFMMGDNRNNSEDSHIWGFTQREGSYAAGPEKGKPAAFTGHAFVLFWPLNRVRLL
jgi:signal peptidase I